MIQLNTNTTTVQSTTVINNLVKHYVLIYQFSELAISRVAFGAPWLALLCQRGKMKVINFTVQRPNEESSFLQ